MLRLSRKLELLSKTCKWDAIMTSSRYILSLLWKYCAQACCVAIKHHLSLHNDMQHGDWHNYCVGTKKIHCSNTDLSLPDLCMLQPPSVGMTVAPFQSQGSMRTKAVTQSLAVLRWRWLDQVKPAQGTSLTCGQTSNSKNDEYTQLYGYWWLSDITQ